ncbi:DUF4397 domain-containing protein [Vibrio astriarenae]|uniref:DUF4397 domain-containing protein n=1 Tax=Vibrio astriarenae TaxID=1481923 RepID=UPI0037363940
MNKLTLATLMATSVALIGCDDDDDNVTAIAADAPQSSLQAVHASADAPRANVWLNDAAALTDVDYATASGFLPVNAGMNAVQVDVQLPGGNVTTVVPRTELEFSADTNYTVMVVGDASGANNPVEPLIVTRPATGSADSETLDVQVVHAASGVGDVNVYVTGPSATIADSAPIATLGYKDFTGVVNVAEGSYRVRLETVDGNIIAFDSGTVDLAAGAELTVAAVINPDSSESASPVKLMVMDGTNTAIIHDMSDPAEVRVGHLVDGAPAVDISLNGSPVDALQGVPFKTVSGYLDLAAGDYDIDVFATGTTSSLIDVDGLSLAGGGDYSVFAVLTTASPLAIEPLVIADKRRSVATSAILNVVHAAANPIAQSVDVYLTANASIEGSDPALSNFTYKSNVMGIYVADGNYFLTITVAGQPSVVAVDAIPVSFSDGVVYSAIAIDDASGSGFSVLLSDITD